MPDSKYVNYCISRLWDKSCYGLPLYHYCPLKHGLTDLKFERAKLSFPYAFNDPLDSVGYYRGYPTFEAFMRYFADTSIFKYLHRYLHKTRREDREIWRENRDIVTEVYSRLCLGKSRPCSKNLLMSLCKGTNLDAEVLLWSHYADSSRGMRICYAFPDDAHWPIYQIKYVKKLPALDFHRLSSLNPMSEEFDKLQNDYHFNMLTSKQKIWEYEEECRLITNVDDQASVYQEGSLWFVRIPNSFVKRVDFGARAFGDDKYKRDEKFLRKAMSLSKETKIPIQCFRMAELQVSKYGFKYVDIYEAMKRLQRRITAGIAKSSDLKMPRGIRQALKNLKIDNSANLLIRKLRMD